MAFQIKIEPEALEDIQKGIDWYNDQEVNLGEQFYSEVNEAVNLFKRIPFFRLDMIKSGV